jgi:hypothetical protein
MAGRQEYTDNTERSKGDISNNKAAEQSKFIVL